MQGESYLKESWKCILADSKRSSHCTCFWFVTFFFFHPKLMWQVFKQSSDIVVSVIETTYLQKTTLLSFCGCLLQKHIASCWNCLITLQLKSFQRKIWLGTFINKMQWERLGTFSSCKATVSEELSICHCFNV